MKIFYQIIAFIMIISTIACKSNLYVDELNVQNGVTQYKGKPYTGSFYSTFSNGVIKKEGEYENGVLNGKYREYYENKQLRYEYEFHDGNRILHGEIKYYHENGNIQSIEHYNYTKRDGEQIEYFDNGVVESKENWINGKRDGEFLYYNYNGTLDKKEIYKDGRRILTENYWNGILGEKEIYKDGRSITYRYDKLGNIISTSSRTW